MAFSRILRLGHGLGDRLSSFQPSIIGKMALDVPRSRRFFNTTWTPDSHEGLYQELDKGFKLEDKGFNLPKLQQGMGAIILHFSPPGARDWLARILLGLDDDQPFPENNGPQNGPGNGQNGPENRPENGQTNRQANRPENGPVNRPNHQANRPENGPANHPNRQANRPENGPVNGPLENGPPPPEPDPLPTVEELDAILEVEGPLPGNDEVNEFLQDFNLPDPAPPDTTDARPRTPPHTEATPRPRTDPEATPRPPTPPQPEE